jgi:predicted glycoside hydrolase/deacetylase ChbG (UPF0249 family)
MTKRWLVVNADDVGLCPEVDEGVLEVVRAGRVTSVSLLVNPPFRPDAAALREMPVSMGLHVNLTMGLPLSPFGLPSLRNEQGRFRPRWFEEDLCIERNEVRDEFLRQVDAFEALTGSLPTHLDTHKHIHARNADVLAVVADLAGTLRVPLRAPNATVRERLKAMGIAVTDHFVGGVEPSPFWTEERLADVLAEIPPGVTEMMCHPGRPMPEMEGLRYTHQRDTERKTLLSPSAGRVFVGFSLATFSSAPISGGYHGM